MWAYNDSRHKGRDGVRWLGRDVQKRVQVRQPDSEERTQHRVCGEAMRNASQMLDERLLTPWLGHKKLKQTRQLSTLTKNATHPTETGNKEVFVKQTQRSDAIIPPPHPHLPPQPHQKKRNKLSSNATKHQKMEFVPRAAVGGGPTTSVVLELNELAALTYSYDR